MPSCVRTEPQPFAFGRPGATSVDLDLGGTQGQARLAMQRGADGWHELVTAAAPGARYRFVVGEGLLVPDPASRFNPDDVHGASEVVDPLAYTWRTDWRGRSWHEAVVYELHVGTFTPEGTFAAAAARLPELAALGVTAIELMPVADFPGARNWGYDGVLPFAPDASYGRPDDLKALVDTAHGLGMMVLLDVVYNHFGPEGNYLHAFCPQFFNPKHQTPWGAAINFDGEDARTVRDFFIHNALYWVEEYRFDGLRLDAIHAIRDDSTLHIVNEIAARAARRPGTRTPRPSGAGERGQPGALPGARRERRAAACQRAVERRRAPRLPRPADGRSGWLLRGLRRRTA